MDFDLPFSSWLAELAQDPELLQVAFVLVIALATFLFVLAAVIMANGLRNPVARRVDSLRSGDGASQPQVSATAELLERLGQLMAPSKRESKRVGNVAAQLRYAGYTNANAVMIFFGLRLVCILLLGASTTWLSVTFGGLPVNDAVLFGAAAAAVGYVLPDILLGRQARRRQDRIRRALPDALDLLVVCAEAGLGLNAAIQRVADEIEIQHPDLAGELQAAIMQTRAGYDVRSALKELAERTDVQDITAFVTMLLQSMRFGTSISETLRIFADEMRDKRLQRAQEKAAKLSVKILIPIALFIMPAFLVVAMGPAVLSLMQALG